MIHIKPRPPGAQNFCAWAWIFGPPTVVGRAKTHYWPKLPALVLFC